MTIRNPGFDFNALMAGADTALEAGKPAEALQLLETIVAGTGDWVQLNNVYKRATQIQADGSFQLQRTLVEKMGSATRAMVSAAIRTVPERRALEL